MYEDGAGNLVQEVRAVDQSNIGPLVQGVNTNTDQPPEGSSEHDTHEEKSSESILYSVSLHLAMIDCATNLEVLC